MAWCAAEAAVYFGDHPVDAQAAAAANVPFVAVLSGTTQRAEFDDWPRLAVIQTIREIPRLISELVGDRV